MTGATQASTTATTGRALDGLRILDLTTSIAGGYCTKLLADGGATVVKAEPPGGDPFRAWSASGALTGTSPIAEGDDGALFQYLHAGKRSVIVDLTVESGRERARELAAQSDIVVEDFGPEQVDEMGLGLERLKEGNPAIVLVSISKFGWKGPWAGRAATEFTLQAWAGSTANRGVADQSPLAVGMRTGEWVAGGFAALAALVSSRRARRTNRAEQADVSMLESLILTHTVYQPLAASMGQAQSHLVRHVEWPSIEMARDGMVGFCTVQARTWRDFCAMVEHPEWGDDPELNSWAGRNDRVEELGGAVTRWLSDKTVDEVIEIAAAMRIAVAPIGNGERTPTFEHFVDRGVFVDNPGGFIQPRMPYQLSAQCTGAIPAAPRLGSDEADPFGGGADSGVMDRHPQDLQQGRQQGSTLDGMLPLEGIRVADFTGAWAGSFGAQLLAMLGAEVVKIEAASHPDPARFGSVWSPDKDQWWEAAPIFHGVNTNKRDLTLELNDPKGIDLAKRLIAVSDIVLENFSPRVMDHFGLGYDTVRALNPSAVMVRMPAFGLSGPWRDRIGYAQTMEQVTGMAWTTGYADGPPLIPRGLCDPLTGLHAVIGVMLGLAHQERTGEGQLIEATMVEAALNIAAEPIVEFSKYGALLERAGNHGAHATPQNVYQCAVADTWVAIAVEQDDQWVALGKALGAPGWVLDPDLATIAGRRHAEDRIDKELAAWCAARTPGEVVEALWPLGVPVAEVLTPGDLPANPQLVGRGFFEHLNHPVIGEHDAFPGLPFRLSEGPARWNRTAAPTLGRDNEPILRWVFGMGDDEIDALTSAGIIGERPLGL